MIPHSSPTPSYLPSMTGHLHIDGDTCPWCEQAIPLEKLEEISGRIKAREREQTQAITAQLEKRYEIDKAQADAKAKAELELERQQSAAREAAAREEATTAAKAIAAQQLAVVEASRQAVEATLQQQQAEAEAARLTAAQAATEAAAQLEQLRQDKETALAAAKAEAERREVEIRAEAVQAAQAKAAEDLKAQREVLEKAKEDALNAERAEKFLETQKLNSQIDALKRTLEEKTADELGEGAEVNLYEALRAAFPDDKIDRVGKGVAGGDVLHVVMHNGRECGTIIYDSKNHKAFRTEHVTKLLADQSAANAEHAILSTHKFPRGTGQLHNQDGVLLANPARVVALATLIRQHMVQTHTLRLSSAERESKTAALYEFIVSEQCAQFFTRLDNCAGDLLELQVKEKKQHEATWKKQGETLRLIQKVQADLSNRINSIIGTAADVEDELELLEAAQ